MFTWGWEQTSRRKSTVRDPVDSLTALLCSFFINISAVTRISRPTTSTRREYHNLVTSQSAMEWRRGASLKAFCCCKFDCLPSSSSSRKLNTGRKKASKLVSCFLLLVVIIYSKSFTK